MDPAPLAAVIRPVYAWFQLDEGAGSGAANALAWFQKPMVAPGNYFYALAQGDYFSPRIRPTTPPSPMF